MLLLTGLIQPVIASENLFLPQAGNHTTAVNYNLKAVPWLCTINNDICKNLEHIGNEKNVSGNNITIVSWGPEIMEDVYVNETVSETIEYSITTTEPMTINSWTIDKVPASGITDGSTASFTHEWDSSETGFHTIVYKGYDNGSEVGFKWYVNVYKSGKFVEGNIFNVIDDVLENNAADIKVRIFKNKIENENTGTEFLIREINFLSDTNSNIQKTRETLRNELKANSISHEEYASAIKKIHGDEKITKKFATEMAKVVKDKTISNQFEKISMQKEDYINKYKENEKETRQGTKGNKDSGVSKAGKNSKEDVTEKPGKNTKNDEVSQGKSENGKRGSSDKSGDGSGENEGESSGKSGGDSGASSGKSETGKSGSSGKSGGGSGGSSGGHGGGSGKNK
jgi:hypothetical protein